jgi:hypothetical protein
MRTTTGRMDRNIVSRECVNQQVRTNIAMNPHSLNIPLGLKDREVPFVKEEC